jgi:peptidoglycan-N-acetylglucosamine deacetylase
MDTFYNRRVKKRVYRSRAKKKTTHHFFTQLHFNQHTFILSLTISKKPARKRVKKVKTSTFSFQHVLRRMTLALALVFFLFLPLYTFINIEAQQIFYPNYFPLGTSKTTKAFLIMVASALVPIDENTVPAPPPVNDSVVFHGNREKNMIALTFDADMTPLMKQMLESGEVASYYDRRITDLLISTQTKATFFLAGMWIELYPDATVELAANSLFEVSNHSYSHPSFDGACYGLGEISDSEDQEQIGKTQDLLNNVAHVDNKYFRFPGGCYSETDLRIVKQNGLTVVHWDVAGSDGFNDDTQSIISNVLDNVKNGSIIILHLSGPPNAPRTADALPTIISTLKERGFTFVKVSEMLAPPPQKEAIDIKKYLNDQYSLELEQ